VEEKKEFSSFSVLFSLAPSSFAIAALHSDAFVLLFTLRVLFWGQHQLAFMPRIGDVFARRRLL